LVEGFIKQKFDKSFDS